MLYYHHSKRYSFSDKCFGASDLGRKAYVFLSVAPFLGVKKNVFGSKKGDEKHEHDGFEAQAEKENSGIKRFFV